MNALVKIGVFLFAVVLVGLAFGGWLTVGFIMTSPAMMPSVQEGTVVFVNRTSFKVRDLKRGEIVLVRIPGSETQVIRRIVGLPGETVEMQEGHVFINGNKIDEPWLGALGTDEPRVEYPQPDFFPSITMPEGRYYLLGDFRKVGNDSRQFGGVTRDAILGTVWTIFGRVM
jgi:signal peptidase I